VKSTIRLIGLALILSGCHSTAPKIDTPQDTITTSKSPEKEISPITSKGENMMARFSEDGSRIIFISQNRQTHKNPQIYILSIKTNKERRITFNDGDDSNPSFDPTGKFILYSSTTDEIKEHPPSSSSDSSFDPRELTGSKSSYKEIYKSENDGSHIVRLTRSQDFDGTPDFSADGHHIVFASKRTGEFKLFVMDELNRRQIPFPTGSKEFEIEPRFSPSGKHMLWIRKIGDGSEIIMADIYGKQAVEITNHDSINRDGDFSPDRKRIIFSSNRENKNKFSLYITDLEGKCAVKVSPPALTEKPVDIFPHFSPDGKKIIFTSNRSGSYQIYIMDFTPPQSDCSPSKS
jgi:Tol biopolymer transport system component